MKKIFRVFIVLILFILILVVSCTAMMNKEMEKAKNELMLVEDPDLSKVEDGIYRGWNREKRRRKSTTWRASPFIYTPT